MLPPIMIVLTANDPHASGIIFGPNIDSPIKYIDNNIYCIYIVIEYNCMHLNLKSVTFGLELVPYWIFEYEPWTPGVMALSNKDVFLASYPMNDIE